MSLDRHYAFQRLNTLWQAEFPVLELARDKNYVLFSDLHLGNGGYADDFVENENTLIKALKYYRNKGNFTLILVGDIEELWQFGLEEIRSRYHSTIYGLIKEFGDENVYRIFGNHDGDWCFPYTDPRRVRPVQLGIAIEALKMGYVGAKPSILICHGHQGDVQSDRDAGISRLAVRFYRYFEPVLKMKKPAFLKTQVIKSYEKIYYQWAKINKALIICGHTHRAIFASRSFLELCQDELRIIKEELRQGGWSKEALVSKEARVKDLKHSIKKEIRKGREIESVEDGRTPLPAYFNTGCGTYEDGITAIEITGSTIELTKWHRDLGHPEKEPYKKSYGKGDLDDFLKRISSQGESGGNNGAEKAR